MHRLSGCLGVMLGWKKKTSFVFSLSLLFGHPVTFLSLFITFLLFFFFFDNRRRKYRLTLGKYRGSTRNQLVIALSSDLPRPLLDRAAPAAYRRSAPSPSAPLTVSNIPLFVDGGRIKGHFSRFEISLSLSLSSSP